MSQADATYLKQLQARYHKASKPAPTIPEDTTNLYICQRVDLTH